MGQIVKYRAMTGSMPMPQELIDRILDHVQGEDDLRTCAFVCRAWRTSSYRHLFSDLLFDSPTDTSGTADSPCHAFSGVAPHLPGSCASRSPCRGLRRVAFFRSLWAVDP
ncbi:hypothetical protein BDZ89DRAFT_724739 [Hymenopellis radicata]|nr:hypothetical protein BDZ89DRAFT_724739 [Hymenopellis radicata]